MEDSVGHITLHYIGARSRSPGTAQALVYDYHKVSTLYSPAGLAYKSLFRSVEGKKDSSSFLSSSRGLNWEVLKKLFVFLDIGSPP
jgi:hypothetical protein